jgi:hypothetical protein
VWEENLRVGSSSSCYSQPGCSPTSRGTAALLDWLLFNLALFWLLRGAISAHSIGKVAVEKRSIFPRVRDVIRHSRQLDEPLKGVRVSRHIPGQVLEGLRIIRRYRLSDVRGKAQVIPVMHPVLLPAASD